MQPNLKPGVHQAANILVQDKENKIISFPRQRLLHNVKNVNMLFLNQSFNSNQILTLNKISKTEKKDKLQNKKPELHRLT